MASWVSITCPSYGSEKPNILIVGTGEYATGYVHDHATASDKKCGVVALTFFDLRARGSVGQKISLCGVTGSKLPAIREFLREKIEKVYTGLSAEVTTFPSDTTPHPEAYLDPIATFQPGGYLRKGNLPIKLFVEGHEATPKQESTEWIVLHIPIEATPTEPSPHDSTTTACAPRHLHSLPELHRYSQSDGKAPRWQWDLHHWPLPPPDRL